MIETRTIAADLQLETRDGKPARIVGLAIPANQRSHDLGGFVEIITAEAIDYALRDAPDVYAYVNHDRDKIIGRTKPGTLRLKQTPEGLLAEISPPATTDGRDAIENVRSGNIDAFSFGFSVPAGGDSFTQDASGITLRYVNAMKLAEVSIVSQPAAYPQTTVSVRSYNEYLARAFPMDLLARLEEHFRITVEL